MDALLVDREFALEHAQLLRGLCARLGVEPLSLPEDPEARLEEADLGRIVLAGFTGTWESDPVFTRRFLGSALRADRLRWLHLPNAGVDHPVFHALLERRVRLTTSSGAAARPIADTVLGAVLALSRGFPRWWRAQQAHEWKPLGTARVDLAGQTMVVVGLGAIGNEVARLARAFGMRVIGVRRSPAAAGDQVDRLVSPARLAEVLPQADWLVLSMPLTEATRGWIDAALLSLLPPRARVVNVARGQVLDQQALVEALRRGRLAGAYLDVFEEEPLPADSPLWDMPNVLVSPHDASGAAGNRARVSAMFLDNLERWADGRPLRNEVSAA